MNIYDFYITPEEYGIAFKNGISKKNLERRIRDCGWDKKKAISLPIRKQKKNMKKWIQLAEKNGISLSTFYRRINKNWDIEKAATIPTGTTKDVIGKMINKHKKYSDEVLNLIKKNNIPYKTFTGRLKRGWSIEKASTTSPLSSKDVCELAREAYFKKYGHKFNY